MSGGYADIGGSQYEVRPSSPTYQLPDDEEHAQLIRDGLEDCVSCETGSPSPCPTCGRTDPT